MAKTKERNPVTGLRISTPDDFCPALGAHSHSIATWTKLRGAREQMLRQTLNHLFRDLPFVDALDSDSVADFLEGIESPLESLHRMGLQLFVIRARGKKASPQIVQKAGDQAAGWRHNSYIVAPDPAFFWLEFPGHVRAVHMLTGACRDGVQALALHPEKTVHVCSTIADLSGALEGEIPWCPVCFLESTKLVIP